LETGNRKEKIGKRTPVKFAPLLFFEKFNRARKRTLGKAFGRLRFASGPYELTARREDRELRFLEVGGKG
jgi:hypothetical protein